LRPGGRDVLIDLFDSELVEPQEAVGMKIIGQFRDLDRPDRFVWLRGFPDMESRAESLTAFYGGPVWRAHRNAANATMLDVSDVLLLRPARPGSAFTLPETRPPAPDRRGVVVAVVLSLDEAEEEDEIVSHFERSMAPGLGGSLLYFVTEASPNTFPALPVREGERVFVWFSGFPDQAAMDRALTSVQATQVRRLAPTARSLLTSDKPRAGVRSARR
jgi:hypothetical protein